MVGLAVLMVVKHVRKTPPEDRFPASFLPTPTIFHGTPFHGSSLKNLRYLPDRSPQHASSRPTAEDVTYVSPLVGNCHQLKEMLTAESMTISKLARRDEIRWSEGEDLLELPSPIFSSLSLSLSLPLFVGRTTFRPLADIEV